MVMCLRVFLRKYLKITLISILKYGFEDQNSGNLSGMFLRCVFSEFPYSHTSLFYHFTVCVYSIPFIKLEVLLGKKNNCWIEILSMLWLSGRQTVHFIYHNVLFITEGELFNTQCISGIVLSVKDPMTRQLHCLPGGHSENRVHLKSLVYLAKLQMSRLHPWFAESDSVVSVLGILPHKLLWVRDCVLFFILFPVQSTYPENRHSIPTC